MARHTPHYALPYPEGRDRVAVHSDVERLALKTDQELRHVRTEAVVKYTISHVAQDRDGQPYFAPGTGTTRVVPDIDGTPFFIPS